MNKYQKNVIDKARKMLTGDTDLHKEGRAMTELLEISASNPATNPQDNDLLAQRVEDILNKVDKENLMLIDQVQLGRLMRRFHPDSWIADLVNDEMEESPSKQTILDHVQKGETYEYTLKSDQNSGC